MRLEINIQSGGVDWPPTFEDGLRRLVQRGLELEIIGGPLIE
jgi:hypothetical protein